MHGQESIKKYNFYVHAHRAHCFSRRYTVKTNLAYAYAHQNVSNESRYKKQSHTLPSDEGTNLRCGYEDWTFETGAFIVDLSMVFIRNAHKILMGFSQRNRTLKRQRNNLIISFCHSLIALVVQSPPLMRFHEYTRTHDRR